MNGGMTNLIMGSSQAGQALGLAEEFMGMLSGPEMEGSSQFQETMDDAVVAERKSEIIQELLEDYKYDRKDV